MSSPIDPCKEESSFLVNQVRSDLWKPVDVTYFQPATWEKVVNDSFDFHGFRQYVQLMLMRLDRSDQDLTEEALALGKLIMNEDNWRFYCTVKSLVPPLRADYFANGKHINLKVLYTFLKPRVSQRDFNISQGTEQKRFDTIKSMTNSLNITQMRELCKTMFGHDDEKNLNVQQKRLLKSYIEYAYPKDVVEYTRATNLVEPGNPETYANGPGKLEVYEIMKGLPRNCVLPPGREAMKDKPPRKGPLSRRTQQTIVNKHVSDADTSQDEPPLDLLVELHRSKSTLDVPSIKVIEPTPEPINNQRPRSRSQTKARPGLKRTTSLRSKKNHHPQGHGDKNDRSVASGAERVTDVSPINLPFAVEPPTPDIRNVQGTRSIATAAAEQPQQHYTSLAAAATDAQLDGVFDLKINGPEAAFNVVAGSKSDNAEPVITHPPSFENSEEESDLSIQAGRSDPFGRYDGACDCPSLIDDDFSPEKKSRSTSKKISNVRAASFTWKQKYNFSVPSPSDGEPLTPQVTVAAVNGDFFKNTNLVKVCEQTLTILPAEKENVERAVQTPGMLLRAEEKAKFERLRRSNTGVGCTGGTDTKNNSEGSEPTVLNRKQKAPVQETDEDWFMPEVKTPFMISWTQEDAEAAEAAVAKQKADAEATAARKKEKQILRETRSQTQTTRQKNELEGPNVVPNSYNPKRRMSPTTLKTIIEANEADSSQEIGKIVQYILKRSSSSASILSENYKTIVMTDEDFDLIKCPHGLTFEEDIRISLERANIDFPRFPPLAQDGRPVQDILRDLLPRLVASGLTEDTGKNGPVAVILADKPASWGPLHFEKPLPKVAEQDLDSTNVPYYMGRGRPGPGCAPPECQQIGFNPVPEAVEWYKGYCVEKREESRKQRAFVAERNRKEREEERKNEARERHLRHVMQQSRPMNLAEQRAALMREAYGEAYMPDVRQTAEKENEKDEGRGVKSMDMGKGKICRVVQGNEGISEFEGGEVKVQEIIARHEKGKKKAVRFEEK